ncbi:hypothetical protein [Fodinibius halophilus]|uniref:DUF4402 domain-containing protein n=1 Tax=Fodinibius halophilus TaxID=1736908 RepID=A0A6M1TGQ4_9BACT|nr:hypothetical protein [Fodinibius halophilus]NGP87830.1 hypothetical protein [Fodinibius halophilus]
MKRTISLLSALAFVLVFVGSAFAQPTQAVTTTANVQAQINITKNADVDFGSIQATSNPDLVPNGSNTDVGAGATLGKLSVTSANTSQQLVVSWNQATVTLDDGSSNTITYTPAVTANSSDDASASSTVSNGTANSNTSTSSSGELYIYIGGDLGSLSGQTAGTYTAANGSGNLVFTVNYQ